MVTKKCKTTEQFKKEVYDLVGDEYFVLNEYINANTKISFVHNECGNNFEMRPSNFLTGQRCSHCKKTKLIKRLKDTSKTTEQFKKEIYDLVNDEYELLDEYMGAHKKIKFKHLLCKECFYMSPSKFLSGQRCTNKECLHNRWSDACANKKGTSFYENFKKNENEYEILTEYRRYNESILFRHKICGCEFERTPNSFFNDINNVYKIKCPECLKKKIRESMVKTTDEYKNEVYCKYRDEYTVVGEYIDIKTKIKVKHNKCNHIWEPTPCNFPKYTACPFCSNSKGENKIINFLEKNNIDFIHQKSFKNLIGIGGGLLSYDFYLPQYNKLIEYQGEQHEYPIDIFGGEEQFKIQQEHDKRKRQFAKDNNIELLEIWYYDFDNIEEIIKNKLIEINNIKDIIKIKPKYRCVLTS